MTFCGLKQQLYVSLLFCRLAVWAEPSWMSFQALLGSLVHLWSAPGLAGAWLLSASCGLILIWAWSPGLERVPRE